ncbi:adenine-specific methyltransferase EcoRI family protein [[Micrococcus luteus] ATCC 49442]|uniref:adenine-specific methyltransferase EcoRI family protein n=1 Tax=[Micrococcus luteus] ATCC 49442 TaxID=2698727 RepID=UPI0013DC35F4
MARVVEHSLLHKAKKNKNDEFYTQRVDIERELQHYTSQYIDKVVYCNCDDPAVSNFFAYFYENFERLGLKKLIATGYINDERGFGSFFEYTGKPEERARFEANDFHSLEGDGDFRGAESVELLKEADIVVTNPPFSLFREFIAQMVEFDKKFLVIANVNAITYKEVFNLIQAEKAWLGVHLGRGISGFIVPENYELYGTEARIDSNGNRVVSPNNCLWLTNLDYQKRHNELELTKSYHGNEAAYPRYDNFDGINVNKTKDIPADYTGYMGVPITFLHKHNPDQFEVIRFRKGDDGKDLSVGGKCPFFRIIIRKKGDNPDPKKAKVELLGSQGWQTRLW